MDHLLGHLRRYGHNVQGDLGGGAHGVNIADGIGRRDLPEHKRVIHNGREEIQRLHDRQIVADAVHRRVIAGIVAHQQVFILYRGDPLQDLAQHAGAHLGAAPPAGGQLAHFDIALHLFSLQ